jgi:hypothetical protein
MHDSWPAGAVRARARAAWSSGSHVRRASRHFGNVCAKKGHLVPYFLFLLLLMLLLMLLCLCGMRTADRASIGKEGILSLEIQLK